MNVYIFIEFNKELSLHVLYLWWLVLTGIILWCHGSLQDLCEGLQPLVLLPLLLTHEDKASPWRPHRDATLPLVSPSVLGFTLLH